MKSKPAEHFQGLIWTTCLAIGIGALCAPDIILGTVQPNKACTSRQVGCCSESDGCHNQGASSLCEGTPFANSHRTQNSAFMICEDSQGHECHQDAQATICCTTTYYSGNDCDGGDFICSRNESRLGCQP